MNQTLHTPEGVRDIYQKECRKKLELERKLHRAAALYGYQDIQTPMFEYADVFQKDIGTVPSKEQYKFFDREGEILTLRPDMTPAIARAAAGLYETGDMPLRLCCFGETFVNHSNQQRGQNISAQLDAELIGVGTADADVEMLAMAFDCLKESGLKQFHVTLGHVGFFQGLLEAACLSGESERLLREYLRNGNASGIKTVLNQSKAGNEIKEAFEKLDELHGTVEILKIARKYAPVGKAMEAISRLEKVFELLKFYGIEEISFDLRMTGKYGYYTGIIFRVETEEVFGNVMRGGRYDHLLEKYGKSRPAVGFTINIDRLLESLEKQEVSMDGEMDRTIVLFLPERQQEAIELVQEFRSLKKQTELIGKRPECDLEEYCRYGLEHFAGRLIYLKEGKLIEVHNLLTNEQQTITADEE